MTARSLDVLGVRRPNGAVAVAADEVKSVVDLLRDAAKIRLGLPEANVGGELLLSCVDPYLFAAAALAAWDAGFAVALPPNLRPGTVRALTDDGPVRDRLSEDESGLSVPKLMAGSAQSAAIGTTLEADRHIATVHTSGSTGGHRGIRKTAGQLLGEARTLARVFELTSGPVLATVPPHHIYGLLFGVLAPLAAGIPFVRERALHAETVAATVQAAGVKVLVSTPAHLRGLEVLESGGLDGLQTVFSSGAPLHPETGKMLWERFGVVVTEVLGSTETGGIGWRRSTGGQVGAHWQALPGVGVDAAPDGRLVLDSPFCPPDDPRPRLCDDRIELVGPGRFVHLGRWDDVIKIAGKRLSLGELERRVLAVEGVDDAAAWSVDAPDGRGQRVRIAAVAQEKTSEEIREALLAFFDPTVLPRKIVLVDALPRESTGKLSRARLEDVFRGHAPRKPELLVIRDEADGTRVVQLRIPTNFYYFQGHFPLEPILPGVAQLEVIILEQVRRRWPELTSLRKLSRLKFMRKLGPGDEIELLVRRVGARVTFQVQLRDGTVTGKGTMTFATPA